jgi:hypothetical protein
MCTLYDAMLAVAVNIDDLLTRGKEFEEPSAFMKGWRDLKFTGCSGLIQNDKHSNNRIVTSFVVQQV